MAGIYEEGRHKELSGVYSRIVTAVRESLFGQRGVVAYPFTADWGPVNVFTETTYAEEFDAVYHAAASTATANKIYTHAFKGKPSKVLGFRLATADAATGKVTLPTGWTLETLYPSARSFSVRVTDSLTGGKIVEILEAGNVLTKVEANTPAELTQALNFTNYVRVTAEGADLPAVTNGEAFTGGSNGSAITGAEYTLFREMLEGDGRAKSFALDDYTNASEVAASIAWTQRVREDGLYITFVNGGPLTWDTNTDTANGISKSYNSRAIFNVGNGVDGYSAGDLAIFIAARAASVALNRTLTDETVPYSQVNRKLTKAQRIAAKKAGTIVFVQNGDFVDIDEAVNTFTTLTDPDTQRVEFGKIRVHNVLDQVLADLEVFGNEYKKSRSNTPEARETYAAAVEQEYFGPLIDQEVLQPGATYRPDPEYHGPNATKVALMDEAYFASSFKVIDSMEKIYQKFDVSF